MSEMTLYIGNKNYSSWSLRAWLALKQAGAAFEEILIPLDEPGVPVPQLLSCSPSGKVPVLRHGDLTVWESLAIAEYVAELHPEARLWPADRGARATARSISAEMATGFMQLRAALPMNIRRRVPGLRIPEPAARDIRRVTQLWSTCRERFGQGGDFLFGHFTIADAMYAPVVARLQNYGVEVDATSRAYMDAIWSLPAMRAWAEASEREPHIIRSCEAVADAAGAT